MGTVTGAMIREIEDLGDISESDSRQLKVLCDMAMEVRGLFMQSASAGSAEDREGQDMTFIYCPTWLKFQYLAEILEASLADVSLRRLIALTYKSRKL